MSNIFEEFVEEKVFSEETKNKLIDSLNESIDIPIIGEKTERKIIDALVSTVFAVFRKVILGK